MNAQLGSLQIIPGQTSPMTSVVYQESQNYQLNQFEQQTHSQSTNDSSVHEQQTRFQNIQQYQQQLQLQQQQLTHPKSAELQHSNINHHSVK